MQEFDSHKLLKSIQTNLSSRKPLIISGGARRATVVIVLRMFDKKKLNKNKTSNAHNLEEFMQRSCYFEKFL